ncbi:hypothetical protein KLU848_1636 [Kluyveromyces marxianus]
MLVRPNECLRWLLWLLTFIVLSEGRILPSWFWDASSNLEVFPATVSENHDLSFINPSRPTDAVEIRRRDDEHNATDTISLITSDATSLTPAPNAMYSTPSMNQPSKTSLDDSPSDLKPTPDKNDSTVLNPPGTNEEDTPTPTPDTPTPDTPTPDKPTPDTPTPDTPTRDKPTPDTPTPDTPTPDKPTPDTPTPDTPKSTPDTPKSTPDTPTPTPDTPKSTPVKSTSSTTTSSTTPTPTPTPTSSTTSSSTTPTPAQQKLTSSTTTSSTTTTPTSSTTTSSTTTTTPTSSTTTSSTTTTTPTSSTTTSSSSSTKTSKQTSASSTATASDQLKVTPGSTSGSSTTESKTETGSETPTVSSTVTSSSTTNTETLSSSSISAASTVSSSVASEAKPTGSITSTTPTTSTSSSTITTQNSQSTDVTSLSSQPQSPSASGLTSTVLSTTPTAEVQSSSTEQVSISTTPSTSVTTQVSTPSQFQSSIITQSNTVTTASPSFTALTSTVSQSTLTPVISAETTVSPSFSTIHGTTSIETASQTSIIPISNPFFTQTKTSSFYPSASNAVESTSLQALQTQHPTLSSLTVSGSAAPTTNTVGTQTSSKSIWLPTSLVVDTSTSNTATSSTSIDLGATSTLPQAINPATPVTVPEGYTVITIGFKEPLNYPFLISNPLASAQIFSFLPKVVTYPFSSASSGGISVYRRMLNVIKRDENSPTASSSPLTYTGVQVRSIVPLTIKNISYIVSIAEVIFPEKSVPTLQKMILDSNSAFYTNPVTYLSNLAELIDPSIPLTGLTYSGSSSSSGENGSGSGSDSNGHGSSGGSNDTEKKKGSSSNNSTLWGSLDAGLTSGFPNHSTAVRFICIVTTLTAATLFLIWLFLLGIGRLYKVTKASERLKLPEKDWPEIVVPYNHRDSGSIASGPKNIFYSGSHSSGSDSTGSALDNNEYIDEDLVITGENTVYSISQGITYYIDAEGNFFFAGVGKDPPIRKSIHELGVASDIPVSQNIEKSIPSFNGEDAIHIPEESASLNLEDLEVDEDGNVALPESDLEKTILQHVSSESNMAVSMSPMDTMHNDNLQQVQAMFPLSSSSDEHVYTDTDALVTTVTKTLLSSNGSAGILDLAGKSGTYDEYLYDAAQEDIDDPLALKNSIAGDYNSRGVSSIDIQDQMDIDIEDYDDDVSDVNVGDYDEFDEEMYRHLSRSDLLPNFGGESLIQGSNLTSVLDNSTDSGISFNMHSNLGSYGEARTSTISSSNVPHVVAQSDKATIPKRPERPSVVFSFGGMYDRTSVLDNDSSLVNPFENNTEEKKSKSKRNSRNLSKEFAAELGITEAELKAMERHPSDN